MRESSRLWDYEVLDELGRGEYGQVFKVKNTKDGQFYALKKVNIVSCHVHPFPFSKNKKYRPSEKSKPSNSSNTPTSSNIINPSYPWTIYTS